MKGSISIAYVRTLGRELSADNIIMTGILPGGFIGPLNAMQRLKTKNKKANKFWSRTYESGWRIKMK